MKFIVHFLAMALLSFAMQRVIPHWWIVALVPAVICFFSRPGTGQAFLYSFATIFILWGGESLLMDLQNESRLSTGIAELFFHTPSPHWLIISSGIIGGITAGLSGLCGFLAYRLFEKN
jgi:hypothetical protein